MKILIVDDEVDIVDTYCSIFINEDHDVAGFTSSVEALESIKVVKYDLIITDQKMPGVTGLDILKYVEEHLVETPVFIMSGDDEERISLKNSKSKFFKKPFSIVNLLKKVNSIS
jgi:DNA-binding response OmpR family regulator